MADDVTPVSMLLRYWSLKVPTLEGTASVGVHSYKCRTPAYGGTVNEERIKDAFIGVSKKKIIDEAGGSSPYVEAFVGKASPETFERVLALVYPQEEGAARKCRPGAGQGPDHLVQFSAHRFDRRGPQRRVPRLPVDRRRSAGEPE